MCRLKGLNTLDWCFSPFLQGRQFLWLSVCISVHQYSSKKQSTLKEEFIPSGEGFFFVLFFLFLFFFHFNVEFFVCFAFVLLLLLFFVVVVFLFFFFCLFLFFVVFCFFVFFCFFFCLFFFFFRRLKQFWQSCLPSPEKVNRYTVKPQWLEHLWDHENLFVKWVVRATEG